MLETPWSESPLVGIPRDVRILAGSVLPAKPNSEIQIKLMVSTIDEASGLEYVAEVDAARGTLLNFVSDAKAVDPRDGEVKSMKDVPFNTDTLVLDIRGGNPINNDKNQTEPGEVLLVDSTQSVIARNEADDAANYQAKLAAQTEAPAPVPNIGNLFQGRTEVEPARRARAGGGRAPRPAPRRP